MSYISCRTCNGTGKLWGTPPLIKTQLTNQVDNKHDSLNRDEGTSFGLDVTCWRCVGAGWYNEQDAGDSNG